MESVDLQKLLLLIIFLVYFFAFLWVVLNEKKGVKF